MATEDINGDGVVDVHDCSGSYQIYGNGSAGALTITPDGTTSWRDTPPANNDTSFTDFAVPAATTLIVPSGTIIRCTGTFTNSGTIVVRTGAQGGLVDIDSEPLTGVIDASINPPGLGVALGIPAIGENAFATTTAPTGGVGGIGLGSAFAAALVLRPGAVGGGGGASSTSGRGSSTGGNGGGSFVVLARGAVTNEGTISANGGIGDAAEHGAGGGGGGVVILASLVSVTNNAAGALISVKGGAGENGNSQVGAGGGGGGGIIHLIAPAVATTASNADVTGGAGGTAASITTNPNAGGGGGGACGGSGGMGGNGAVPTATPANGHAGLVGFLIQSQQDPTDLF